VLNDFTDFLTQKIKVEGKTGNLSNAVTIGKDRNNVVVTASIDFSKRYLKYLTKKYLKKQQMREYLRVVATNKNTYELRYLQVDNDEEEAKE
jgi:large subunit ribosomal protein L22e